MGVHLVGGMWVTFNVYCPGVPVGHTCTPRGTGNKMFGNYLISFPVT